MIDAKELRIGNWVNAHFQTTSFNAPVVGIMLADTGGRYIQVYCVDNLEGYSEQNIDPIPLTTEILLKCGFELAHTNATYFIHDDMSGDFVPRKDGFYLEDYEGQDITNLPIKYVHQLQNLYFALTQKELEIKL